MNMKDSNYRENWKRLHNQAFNVAAAADQAALSALRTETYLLLETGVSFPDAKRALQKLLNGSLA